MSERGLDPDSYLTEIDRRLRAIQAELRPGQGAPAPQSPATIRAIERQPAPARRGRTGPLSAILGRAPARSSETEPAHPPEPVQAPAPAEPSGAAGLVDQVRALTEVQARLVDVSERLLESFARIVDDGPQAGVISPTTTRVTRTGIEVSAGPFVDTDALREFERALAALDPVRRVTVRGYQGTDRAILDVELEPAPTSERVNP
jgi:hypothetical protein